MVPSKMKRSKGKCVRCEFTKNNQSKPYVFKPLAFQELNVDCVKGCKPGLPVPQPRSGHRIVCEDGNLYSFGGYLQSNLTLSGPPHLVHGNQKLFQELWCYNFAEGQWKELPTLGTAPIELASHSAVLHGNHLLVFGGTGVPFGSSSSNRMNICDLRTLEWKSLETTGEAPIPQYGQAIVLDRENRDVYVIGGTTGYTYSMDIHKLNLNTLEWERLFVSRGDLSEPEPRYRHEVAFDGENIYTLGGGTAVVAYNLKDVATFNVKTCEWIILETTSSSEKYPAPRKCQGSIQLGNKVYICGGYDSTTIFFDLWMLDLSIMNWTELLVTMPVPLYFHSVSVTNTGCMYIFGGVTNMNTNTRINDVFKIWLKVPKLKEMCWEALLHYNKKIRLAPHSELLKLGIPQEFVNRVHPSPPCGLSQLDNSQYWASDLLTPLDSDVNKVLQLGVDNAPFAIGY